MEKQITVSSYKKLVQEIGTIFEEARRSLVQAYWQIGKRIVEVEQEGEIRAAYGKGLIKALSEDLSKKYGAGFSTRNLCKIRKFYVLYKKVPAPAQLPWTQYSELLSVADTRKRERFEKLAKTKNLHSKELRKIIKKDTLKSLAQKPADVDTKPLKRPSKLILDTYKKITDKDILSNSDVTAGNVLVDCGFFVYREISKDTAVNFSDNPSYTFRAVVERVIDGDTIKVVIDTGFGNKVRQKLRFRGIDSPELGTPEGEEAKKYTASVLPKGKRIVIKSHQTDIYGRFVADIFYTPEPANPEEIIANGIFLNNELLEKGLANRMEM